MLLRCCILYTADTEQYNWQCGCTHRGEQSCWRLLCTALYC